MKSPTLLPVTIVAVLALGTTSLLSRSAMLGDTSIIIAIYALIALSVGITYGLCGLLSVAQASFAALGAYVTAILTSAHGWSPWASLPLALLIPACFAYPFARLVTRLSPLALAIATLMFGYVFDSAVREGGAFTGGYIGLSGIPSVPGVETPSAFHLLAWGFVVLAMVFYGSLRNSHIGLALRTIRSDALRAAADGVDVAHLCSVTMSISAALAGMAGWLYAHHLTYMGPESLSPALSLSALLMAVIGGARTLLGPVIGAAILTLLFQVIPGQESLGMFYGGTLILCLLIAPEGLSGLSCRLWRRLRLHRPVQRSDRVESPEPHHKINLEAQQ